MRESVSKLIVHSSRSWQSECKVFNIEGGQLFCELSEVRCSRKYCFVRFDWVASLEFCVNHLAQRLSLLSSFKRNKSQFTTLFYRFLLLVRVQVAVRYNLLLLRAALGHILGKHLFNLRTLLSIEFQSLFLYYRLPRLLKRCEVLVLG